MSSQWMVAGLLMVMALAGCADSDEPAPAMDDPTDPVGPDIDDNVTQNMTEPELPPEPRGDPFTFTATGCNAVVWLHIEDFSAIDDFLPPGFHPADISSLLRLPQPANTGQGAAGPVAASCETNSITEQPFGIVLPGTLVDEPALEEGLAPSYVDGYEDFIGLTDPVIAALFEEYGWDVETGFTLDVTIDVQDPDIDSTTGQTRAPGLSVGQVLAMRNSTELFTAGVLGLSTYHTSNPDDPDDSRIRFWHDTSDGLSYIENKVTQHGRTGPGTCEYMPGSRYAQLFKKDACDFGDTFGIVIEDFDLETTLIRLIGVHA